jgi:hypothetical protein
MWSCTLCPPRAEGQEPGYTFTFMWRRNKYWALADECGTAPHLWPNGKVALSIYTEEPNWDNGVCLTHTVAQVTVWGTNERDD